MKAAAKSPQNLRLTDTSSNHLSLLAWVLERNGMNAEKLFSEVGARIPSANSPLDRVPLVTVIRLLDRYQEEAQDPCASLKLYRGMKLAHLNVLGFALSCSSTLLDFFERAQRFCNYIGSAFFIDIAQQGDVYLIEGKWNPEIYREQIEGLPNAEVLMVSLGYSALGIMQDLYGERVPLQHIFLPENSHPAVAQAYSDFGEAPVTLRGGSIGATISSHIMRTRLPGANPELARENDCKLTEQLATLNEHDIVHRCEQLILEGMSFGELNLKQVARRLGTSERVLRQNLRDHGQNFSTVVNRIKKTLAIQHLQENKKSVAEIAYLLAFDSPSNFSRAFKNWTGLSPREFKSQHQGPRH